jgi:hypothetical protein
VRVFGRRYFNFLPNLPYLLSRYQLLNHQALLTAMDPSLIPPTLSMATSHPSQVSIVTLPLEILQKILQNIQCDYLGALDLACLALTCKTLYHSILDFTSSTTHNDVVKLPTISDPKYRWVKDPLLRRLDWWFREGGYHRCYGPTHCGMFVRRDVDDGVCIDVCSECRLLLSRWREHHKKLRRAKGSRS